MTNGPSDDIWFQHFSADEFCKHLFNKSKLMDASFLYIIDSAFYRYFTYVDWFPVGSSNSFDCVYPVRE